MIDYDRWLQAPYQEAAAAGEEEQLWLETLAEELRPMRCGACGTKSLLADVPYLEVVSLNTWVSGDWFEWAGHYRWQCACGGWNDVHDGGDNFA